MKKIIITMFMLAGIVSLRAQAPAHISFQKISFEEAKKQAKETGKLIFLDGYTSWCAPCKWMEGNVFNQKEVADFYNTNFINTKYDCEVGEGIDLAKKIWYSQLSHVFVFRCRRNLSLSYAISDGGTGFF